MKTINDIPGKNPFKVPENYFEKVNQKILSETADVESRPSKEVVYSRLGPFLAVAASVAFFVLLSYALVRIIHTGNENEVLPVISLEEFSEEYLNDIDITELEQDAAQAVMYDDMPAVSSQDIIDYLVLDNLDPNEIYEIL
jgi:hypothetical protein